MGESHRSLPVWSNLKFSPLVHIRSAAKKHTGSQRATEARVESELIECLGAKPTSSLLLLAPFSTCWGCRELSARQTHRRNRHRSAVLRRCPAADFSSKATAARAAPAWVRCPSMSNRSNQKKSRRHKHDRAAARNCKKVLTSMPCRPSGTGVLTFEGESVCISSAQGDVASQPTGDVF